MARAMKPSGVEWLGDIPAEWEIVQLKRFVSVNNGREVPEEIDKTADAVPVYGSGGVFKYTTDYLYKGEAVMFGRKGTLGKPIYANEKLWTVDTMYFLTFSEKLFAKFNYYQLCAFDWEPHITQTALPSIVASEIVSCKFAFPSLDEQQRIAAFLDGECARIDSVVEKTRASIEEYRKLKQSIITRAVTKGIRPNRPTKDSGIDWIGQIPADWEILSFTKSICSIVDYRGKTPEKQDEGTLLVTARNIKDGKIDYDCSREFVRTEDFDEIMHRGKVEIGDVLFTTEAPLGSVANADRTNFALAQRIIKFRGFPDVLDNYYLKFWIMSDSFQQNLATFSTGSTAKGIKASKLGMLKQVLPPLDEQKEIAAYLDEKTAAIDSLVAKKNRLVSELESLKKSLIFEYVTGKKEVPT